MTSTRPASPAGGSKDALRSHPGSSTVTCTIVDNAGAAAEHHRIRHAVFVAEQAIFPVDDVDEHDADIATIKVLGFCDDTPAGTVRLFPTSSDATQWHGDRLAVLAPFRHRSLGGPLVDFAVRTAAARGGLRMTAHIQVPNVRFFEALGWVRLGAIETYVGLPHQPMAVDVRRRAGSVEEASA
ncbi:MAG TPA: MSMEG_0567/Sll0786 family nitrogen starvation N-acetyltransferase [Acidimicrobiales bacterium]|jgi:putative N-acetyltransferase (TIGR04045 family)|nr:MSMEG_0567/Sll0786 family nitrogen starvation N-acetyltransferase [Acidimicrobiales bacterium]